LRRLTLFDRAILGLLGPLWVLCVILHLDRQLAVRPLAWFPVYLEPPQDATGTPLVSGFWPEEQHLEGELAIGDRLLAVGDTSLLGAGRSEVLGAAYDQAGADLRVEFRVERAGAERRVEMRLREIPQAWGKVPLVVALGLSALLALLRGRGSHAVRAYALAALTYSFQWAYAFGGAPWTTQFGLAVFLGAGLFYQPLTLRAALLFPENVAVRSRLPYALVWLFGPITSLGLFAWLFGAPISGTAGLRLLSAGYVSWIALFLAVLALQYRRTDAPGRRQLRWVLLGFYLGLVPVAAAGVWLGVHPSALQTYELSLVATVMIPVCLYVALLRDSLYDINRLITNTAAWTLLSPFVLGLVLQLGPATAAWVSAQTGLLPTPTLWGFAFLFAAPFPWLARRLRPAVERLLFRRQFEREQALRRLRADVDGYGEPGSLLEAVGARLHEIFCCDTTALYGRAGGAFVRVFARGPLVPQAIEAAGPLPALIAAATGPVPEPQWRRWGRQGALDPAALAALESLGASLLLPLRRADELAAFICLGERNDGEPFSRTELSLLDGLAERISLALTGVEREALERAERELYELLAQYAPGTVAEEIRRGTEIAPGVKEVTVLFVDIRGYTTFSQSRNADEIFRVVNAYTLAVSMQMRDHGGAVIEFQGDGLLAVFGAPGDLPAKERAAVEAGRAAIKVVEGGAIAELEGLSISVGVGIATGEVYVGNIQSIDRKIWSVIGNTTNIAARLEGMTRTLEVAMVIDETTWARAGDAALDFEARSGIRLKGRSEDFTVYALPLSR